MDEYIVGAINALSDCVNHYLDTVNMELDFSFENGMPPVISRRGWPLPVEACYGKLPGAIAASPSDHLDL
jgi:hypothetical protein